MSNDRFTITHCVFVAQEPDRVWTSLLHPSARWMLGANIETSFQPGSKISFEGNFFGRKFADHGEIIACERPRLLRFTHFSPLSGFEDVPENYHDITLTLTPAEGGTQVSVLQANIISENRAARAAAQWAKALASLAHSKRDNTA